MKREIKYRAFTDFGMFYGVAIYDSNCFGMSSDNFYKQAKKPKGSENEDWEDLLDEFNLSDNNDGWIHGDGIICQFTGLKDKNGKEIYEEDILRTQRGDWGVVKYKAPYFGLTVSETQISLYNKEWIEDCEIIGNIYQNPELL